MNLQDYILLPKPMSTIDVLSVHPYVNQVIADKIRGTILGSALGDAIGLYTEFLSKDLSRQAYPECSFTLIGNVTKFKNDSHRNKFYEGSWTDDTDHALLLVLSYLNSDGKDLSPEDFAKRLRIWIEQGLRCLEKLPLGLGRTVGRVVLDKQFLDRPQSTAYRAWRGSNFTIAPNGSLMRTHPLGILCVDKSLEETFTQAAELSSVTHADSRCIVACCISCAIIRGILRGELLKESQIDEIVDEAYGWTIDWLQSEHGQKKYSEILEGVDEPNEKTPPPLDREELLRHTQAGNLEALELDHAQTMGYVYKCLGSALWTLRCAMRETEGISLPNQTVVSRETIFENLITDLVMQGGDADTNACAAGALLGCLLGFDALPRHWRNGLRDRDWLLRKCDALIQTLGVENCAMGYVGSEDPDTKEDGGKGMLDEQALRSRENAFMSAYLQKMTGGKTDAEQRRLQSLRSGSTWKDRLLGR